MKYRKSVFAGISVGSLLDNAYRSVCQTRKKSHSNDSVWDLRFHWDRLKGCLRLDSQGKKYKFQPFKLISSAGDTLTRCQDLLMKYCENLIDKDGVLETPRQGIIKGGALSPLLGNFYLIPLDLAMQKIKHIRYVRFMDDWLIVAKKRHHLKRSIKKAYMVLASLKLEIAKEKTSMGKTANVFTFLGYQIGAKKLRVSPDSQKRAGEKLVRLYEQGASKKRIEQYLTRWHIWAQAGLSTCVLKLELPSWITKLLSYLKRVDNSSIGRSKQGKNHEKNIFNALYRMCGTFG